MKKISLSVVAALLFINSSVVEAKTSTAATAWEIIPAKSKIEFQAKQGKSDVTGAFEKFSGKINFDPKQLQTSSVIIEVDTKSIKTSFAEAAETLKTTAWLASAAFPKATFSANKFTKIASDKFRAEGDLTLKGKTLPLIFNFVFEENAKAGAQASGSVLIKRSDFEVGDKDPAKANDVRDEVLVNFVIEAVRKN